MPVTISELQSRIEVQDTASPESLRQLNLGEIIQEFRQQDEDVGKKQPNVDLEALAQELYKLLKRELWLERERAGRYQHWR
jgi:hypothetical protein